MEAWPGRGLVQSLWRRPGELNAVSIADRVSMKRNFLAEFRRPGLVVGSMPKNFFLCDARDFLSC